MNSKNQYSGTPYRETANTPIVRPKQPLDLHMVNNAIGGIEFKPCKAGGDAFNYTASCSICGKRIFDISSIPTAPVLVRMKCPHCRRIINVSFSVFQPIS